MIYLIQSSAYVNATSNEKEDILKIGYCGENSKKSRIGAYITENPTMRILYQIPGGTQEDERNLHIHFKEFNKPYGREWFSYSPEILEFFETHTTSESLQEIDPNFEDRKRNKLLEIYGDQVRRWINSILSFEYQDKELPERIDISESLVDTLLYYRENMEEYVRTTYPDNWDSIYELYQELSKPPSPKIQEYLDHFNSLSTFPDKMRYFQDVTIILGSSPELGVFLDQIPRRMRDYYEVFGFERMKALKYSESLIKKEWEKIKGNFQIKDSLVSRIYSEFQEGSGYSKSFIKEKLREIYQELGYIETPKANLIEEFFEVKSCQITNKETGKRDNGFKLIKKKK